MKREQRRAGAMCVAVGAAALSLAACGGGAEPPAGEPLAVASLDLTLVPSEARCATITVKPAALTATVRTLELGPGRATVVTLSGLPTGVVAISEQVFTLSCAELAATTPPPPPTWISDPVTVTLLAGMNVDVNLVLRRVGSETRVTVRTDFPSTAPVFTEFALAAMSGPTQLTPGPDGNVWYTARTANKIGRITPAGVVTEFDLPTPGALPTAIASGSDGSLWFTQAGTPAIGRITTDGAIREFAIPSGNPAFAIALGPDGNLWFTQYRKLGRVTAAGTITEFAQPGDLRYITAGPGEALWFTSNAPEYVGRFVPATARLSVFRLFDEDPDGITLGPDGALWLTIPSGKVARMASDGSSVVFPLSALGPGRVPAFITAGTDGALWFTSSATGTIGRISTTGVLSEFLTPSASSPLGITKGHDGNLWYADGLDRIGRVRN